MKVLIAKKVMYVWLLAAFCIGFTAKVAIDEIDFISAAYADVGGMNYIELRRDRDFKKAVHYIVESCSVYNGSISC